MTASEWRRNLKIIICLDERKGLLFNQRRQTKDRKVIEDIAKCRSGMLYISPFSEKLFADSEIPYVCEKNYLELAGENDFCFAESLDFLAYLESVKQITVYWWNRHYPSDVRLELNFDEMGFTLIEQTEFPGYSHEKITKEIYHR